MVVLSLLLTFAIPVAIVVAIVARIRDRRADDDTGADVDEGIGTVRRAFIYGLALVALVFAGVGVSMLIGGILESAFGDRVIAESDSELAIALAFTVVGVPSWVLFAALAQRSVTREPVEARSQLRWLYFALARGIALVIVLVRGVDALEWVFGSGDFDAGAWGWTLTWFGLWALHEGLVRQQPAPSTATRELDRLYRYFGAAVGLYVFGSGLISTLGSPALRAYDVLTTDALVADGEWVPASALALLVLGGLTWWWHWLIGVRRDAPSLLWDVHVFLLGILVGVAVTVGAAGVVLQRVLEWAIGDLGAVDTATHFRGAVPALSLLLVAASSWAYHRLVLTEERDARLAEGATALPRSEPERIYRYLVAAAGLVALAVGLIALITLVIDVLVSEDPGFRDEQWWRNDLATALTFLIVGAPLWARYWFAAQRMVVSGSPASGGVEEIRSPSRRVFLFGVFGVAIIAALVSLVVLLFQFFDAILGEGLTAEVIRDARVAIATLITTGVISVYYWLVLREHQGGEHREALPTEAGTAAAPGTAQRMALREVVFIGGPVSESLRRRLEASGVRVRHWRRLDLDGAAPLPDDRAEGVLERLAVSEHPRVAVILDADGEAQLVPFEPGD